MPRCHSRYFTAPPAVVTMSMSGALEARKERGGGAAAGARQRRARERGAEQRMSQVVQVP